MTPLRPNTLAQTNCHCSFFACNSAADHTFRARRTSQEVAPLPGRTAGDKGIWYFAEQADYRVHARGAVQILSRTKLEECVCECYEVIQQYNREIGLK